MRDIATSGLVADFLFGFGALFAIINPYGLAFIFLDKTRGLSEDERASLALRVAGYAFVVLLVSLFLGSQILNFFGVTIPALRIAGRSGSSSRLRSPHIPIELRDSLSSTIPSPKPCRS